MGVGEGFGEEGVAQECAEISIAGKVLEFWLVDDDGARDGLAGLGVGGGFVRGLGLGGDEFGEGEAGWLGEGIEGFEPTGGDRRLDGGFEFLTEVVSGGFGATDGFFRVGADFGDGAVMMDDGGPDDPEERGWDEGEQEEKRALDDGAGFFLIERFSEGADDGFGEFPNEEKGEEEGGEGEAVGDPSMGSPGPLDGKGGGLLPDAKPDPCAEAQNHGAYDHASHPAQQHESSADREDDERGGAEADGWDGVGRHLE